MMSKAVDLCGQFVLEVVEVENFAELGHAEQEDAHNTTDICEKVERAVYLAVNHFQVAIHF